MYLNILSNNKNLYKEFSRRKFLFLLTSLPLINGFQLGTASFSNNLKNIIGQKGVVLIANISTGQIIDCTNLNKASEAYTIGSLAKLVTATALLEEKLLSSEDTYFCKGYEIVEGKRFNCWQPSGHGLLKAETAIGQSCNLFFLKASLKIAPEDLIKYYKKYHIDAIELPFEAHNNISHNLPTTGKASDIALGLDQNLLISPLQMLSFACTLARNGVYKPLWIKNPSTTEHKILLTPSTISIVRNGMIHCSTEGTAKLLYQKGFNTAAKTGTAPFSQKNSHGWCIGFTPISKPDLAFCIFVENGTGFSDAVPITAKILQLCKDFNYL